MTNMKIKLYGSKSVEMFKFLENGVGEIIIIDH